MLAITPTPGLADSYVVRVGTSTDSWEQSSAPTNDCAPVAEELVSLVIPDQTPAAVRRLGGVAYEVLTRDEAAGMLGIELAPGRSSLASQILSARIGLLSERKRIAYSERRGSWSMSDEAHLAALNDTFSALDQRPLAPVLVRALAANAGGIERFDVSVCDRTLLTTSFPRRGTFAPDHPSRMALVVLLEAPPQSVVAEWTFDDPDLNR